MASKPETNLVKHLMRYLTSRGGVWIKMHGNQFSGRGHPDIIGCHQGRFHGVEVKRPGGKATTIQLYRIDAIRKAGGVAGVVHNLDELRDLLDGNLHRGVEEGTTHA